MYFFDSCFLVTLCFTLAVSRIVELPNGRIQGTALQDYYSFTNIPYAEPPIRFEASKPYERSWEETWNATGAPVSCVLFGKDISPTLGQEDCLYVNIYIPKTPKDVALLPVFVFLHGGAFMFGSSGLYSPEVIMAQKSMIVVSINYRIGPFGFLTTGDEQIPGNLGLKDQLLALRWIKRNIRHFGGNSENIVLTGMSAGGASVHLHILRKETEKLISAAVSMSGTALNPWVIQKKPKEKVKTLANLLSCPQIVGELKSCLQNRSIEEVYGAFLKMLTFLDNPFNLFGPVVESVDTHDAFLTEEPRSLIEKGLIARIPWMASYTTEEGAFNAASLLTRDDTGVENIEQLNDRWFELAPSLLFYYDEPSEQIRDTMSLSLRQRYMSDQPFSRRTYKMLQRMYTDILFVNGIEETIKLHRKFGQCAVYGYVYANPHSYGIGNEIGEDLEYQFGATHGDDLEILMPASYLQRKPLKGLNGDSISRLMIEMFESFAIEGAPRFGNISLPINIDSGLPNQYLQILERNFCIGPRDDKIGFVGNQRQASVCYEYERQRYSIASSE